MRHIVWSLSGSTSFFHSISQTAWYLQNIIEYKTCVLIFSTNFVLHVSHSRGNWARYNKNVYWSFLIFNFRVFCMFCVFFWVIPRRLNFLRPRFVTLCLFRLYRQVGVEFYTYLPAYEDGTRQRVTKHGHKKFRRRGITQKKT
jgi:hypothetical protein